MNGLHSTAELIRKTNTISELNNLIITLGYRTNPKALHIPSFDLPESAQKKIKEFHIIADYDQKFQIYFVKTASMRRTDFRNILEPFYRHYPQINSLFIFTENWDELAFVSPERVATEPKKVKLLLRILFIDPQNIYHTDIEVLNSISISSEEQKPEIIWQKHSEAFNVERVTKEFFEAYKSALEFIKEDILIPQKMGSYQETHSFAQQLLSRIMFLYYVQKKGWLKWKDYVQDKRYIRNLWLKYKQSNPKKDTFYSLWLSSLFFYAFNKKHQYLTQNIPDEIKESFNLMPFLNGGLFTENELDDIGFKVPDELFQLLFELDPLDKKKGFLERYNFTIREDTPLEVEVAVDPEMLGKVYESLISEEERGKGGIFYTPRIEIDYMCRLSLVEYLSEETKIPKKDLIPLVFEPQRIQDEQYLKMEDLRRIKEATDKVKVVDPAVGSASFLVGMMNVLIEIMRNLSLKIEKREENLFALKNKVLSENLYGVDVKDWAVMVGELRLWLSLIIETEEKFMDIYTKPLLPNLTFKMRQGDSLVEEIAGVQIPLRAKFAYIPKPIKDKITMLVDRKVEYFRGGRSADLKEKDEIEKLENEVLKEIVASEINRLDEEEIKLKRQIASPKPKQFEMFEVTPEQKDLFEEQIKKLKKRVEEIRLEKERFINLLKEIGKKTKKDYFLWEVDFAEIFAEKGGFDIVISNPPYVRQEMIAPPLEREEDFDDKEKWREKKREYKEKLAQSVKIHWGDFIKIDKKSDLYVYFYYHGLALLRPGGVFCFINSDSWLDDQYGYPLQEFLLKKMDLIYIVGNELQRTFESDINTVVVLIKNCINQNGVLKFLTIKKRIEEIMNSNILMEIENTLEKKVNEYFRIISKKYHELLIEGAEVSEDKELLPQPAYLTYEGNKWGAKYIKMPDFLFNRIERGDFIKLEQICELEYGNKPGIIDFFILDKEKINKWKIEKQFLVPIITSTKEIETYSINPSDIEKFIFVCSYSLSELKKKGYVNTAKYIEWGRVQKTKKKAKHTVENVPWPEVPSVKGNRPEWHCIKLKKPGDFIVPCLIRERFFFAINKYSLFDSNMFFHGRFHNRGDVMINDALLNSTITYLLLEMYGRHNIPGRFNIYGLEFKKLPIPNPNLFQKNQREKLIKTFNLMANREVKKIFIELGLPEPCTKNDHPLCNINIGNVSINKVLPDRRELDKIVFEALGLTEEEQLEVYRAVVELVKNRLVKARSV